MNELIEKIEQWANDRNIIKGSKPIDQAMKLFSEFGELSDHVGDNELSKIPDDIGDIFVVLTIMAKQIGLVIDDALNNSGVSSGGLKHSVCGLGGCLTYFVDEQDQISLTGCMEFLESVCYEARLTLEECVQIAYEDIKDRKGVLIDGVFIKESNPAYESIIKSIEVNCGE